MNTSSIVLEGNGLCIGYRNRKQTAVIHSNLNFTLRKGELTCLLGKNGAGKSTLLRTLSGTQPPLSGQLTLNGKPLNNYTEAERSKHIGIVLTDRTQTGGLTVRELVALGRQPHTGFFGKLSRKDFQLIDQAMQAVGIDHKAAHYTAELSDGERQKTMIAKVLVQECPLILLDEPTAFLDVVSRIEIMTLLHRLAATQNKAILLSTHDIEQALMLSDRLWMLTDTHGLETGTTEDLVLNGRMDTLFPNDGIHFNLLRGGYTPAVQGCRTVCLKASDETLRHWTINALARNGIQCIDQPLDAQTPLLTVGSKDELKWTDSLQNTVIFHSFETLISALKHGF